jgi:hypothetical protein
VLERFDPNNAYVKPKHLSTSGGNGAKFSCSSKAEVETMLREAMKNGNIKSAADNGVTKMGNRSYRIVIDAGKPVGTKGETLVRMVLSEDGSMLSAFPVN